MNDRTSNQDRKIKRQQIATTYQYVESIDNSDGLLRTLGEVAVERNIYDEPKFRLGNNAIVFRVDHRNGSMMMKCYIKEQRFKEQIYTYLAALSDPILSPVKLLNDELFVYDIFDHGSWRDVVVAQWVEGNILEIEIKRAIKERVNGRLKSLSRGFIELALELLGKEWAHGDLKPENIVVSKGDQMVLIDYDAMFIPQLAGEFSSEIGTMSYQHPARDQHLFSKGMDDYSIALIAVSLLAIELEPNLYDRYNSGDNIILDPKQVVDGGSECYSAVLSLFAHHKRHYAYLLATKLASTTPELPELEQILRGVEQECDENHSSERVG